MATAMDSLLRSNHGLRTLDVLRTIHGCGFEVTEERVDGCLDMLGCGAQIRAEAWRCAYAPVRIPVAADVALLIELARRRDAIGHVIHARLALEDGAIPDAQWHLRAALAAAEAA